MSLHLNERYSPLPATIDHGELIREIDRHLPIHITFCCTSGTRQGHKTYKGKYYTTKALVAEIGLYGATYVVKVHNFVDDPNVLNEFIRHEFKDPYEAIKKYNLA